MSEQRETVWLTIQEYADTRKVSERTVWRLIKAGKLTVERITPRLVRIRFTRVRNTHSLSGSATGCHAMDSAHGLNS